jgi:hypothetical protein
MMLLLLAFLLVFGCFRGIEIGIIFLLFTFFSVLFFLITFLVIIVLFQGFA